MSSTHSRSEGESRPYRRPYNTYNKISNNSNGDHNSNMTHNLNSYNRNTIYNNGMYNSSNNVNNNDTTNENVIRSTHHTSLSPSPKHGNDMSISSTDSIEVVNITRMDHMRVVSIEEYDEFMQWKNAKNNTSKSNNNNNDQRERERERERDRHERRENFDNFFTPRGPQPESTSSQNNNKHNNNYNTANVQGKGVFSVYTDGSAISNPGPAGFGVVLQGPVLVEGRQSKTLNATLYGGMGRTTNNAAETKAVYEALSFLHGMHNGSNRDIPRATIDASKIIIYSDSLWTCKAYSGEYKVKAPHLKEQMDDIKKLVRQMPVPVMLEWVKAHAGHPENELADKLANQGSRASQNNNVGQIHLSFDFE